MNDEGVLDGAWRGRCKLGVARWNLQTQAFFFLFRICFGKKEEQTLMQCAILSVTTQNDLKNKRKENGRAEFYAPARNLDRAQRA